MGLGWQRAWIGRQLAYAIASKGIELEAVGMRAHKFSFFRSQATTES